MEMHMGDFSHLDVFLNPDTVAVIGATERPGSWGSFIMESLRIGKFAGLIVPGNRRGGTIFGHRAYKDLREFEGTVDLAVLTIPEVSVEEAIEMCAERGVRGFVIVTAGYAETSPAGEEKQEAIMKLARSNGIRLLGPNASGTFNLHARFMAAAPHSHDMRSSPLAATCQGGYAIYDLLASAASRGMGVGRFVHTSNEADLTVTDFLEYFGQDPDVKGVVMYLETICNVEDFLRVARQVTRVKPVVVYKGGRTPGSARAAQSHTGALSGSPAIFEGLFRQAGISVSPTMELLVPLGHALIERPPMKGRRVGIVTMGGSWGVSLTDALEETGLLVNELSPRAQARLRELGLPERASTRNPVDFGASGLYADADANISVGRAVLDTGEVDALILVGLGRPGMLDENSPPQLNMLFELEKKIVRGYAAMEQEFGLPVLIAGRYSPWESQVVWDLNKEGYRIQDRLDETAQLLDRMHLRWQYLAGQL
jgi:acetyltransferase